jgi:hypothetical protein
LAHLFLNGSDSASNPKSSDLLKETIQKIKPAIRADAIGKAHAWPPRPGLKVQEIGIAINEGLL